MTPEPTPKSISKTPKPAPEPVKVEEATPKKKAAKKAKYEELPEIPDYERPELEVYEANDFDPTARDREGLSFPDREKEEPEVKERRRSSVKAKKEELAKIDDYEKPKLEKYERTPYEPAKKEEAQVSTSTEPVKPNTAIERLMELKGMRRKSSVRPEDASQVELPVEPKLGRRASAAREQAKEEEAKKLAEAARKESMKSDKTVFDAPPPKKKYEDLPEIPDYDHPELETYEESDFDPTKKEKAEPTLPAPKEKAEEPAPAKKTLLKPNAKSSIEPTNEDFGEVKVGKPKTPIKKTSTEAEAADAKIKKPATLKPPTVVEEAASKSITIKEPVEDLPIEIMITDSEGSSKNSDQAAAEDAAKKIAKKKYETVPEKEETPTAAPAPAPVEPDSSKSSPPRAKYDPLKYIPDKELPTVEEVNKNTKQNLLTQNSNNEKNRTRDRGLRAFASAAESLQRKLPGNPGSTCCLSLATNTHTIC